MKPDQKRNSFGWTLAVSSLSSGPAKSIVGYGLLLVQRNRRRRIREHAVCKGQQYTVSGTVFFGPVNWDAQTTLVAGVCLWRPVGLECLDRPFAFAPSGRG